MTAHSTHLSPRTGLSRPTPSARELRLADRFLADLVPQLRTGRRSWKSQVNHVLLRGLRPDLPPDLFDTFTDHLFDALREVGVLLAEGPDKALRSVDQRVPEAWHEDSASAERMAMVAEAFTRTLEAYREEDPVQACA